MEDMALQDDAYAEVPAEEQKGPSEGERKLVAEIKKRIRADRVCFADDFKRMLEDMTIARLGAKKDWHEANRYTANITGRHINNKVSALYAKNPKAIARRRQRLDFAIWDETMESLMAAIEVAQMAMQAPPDPMTGLTPAMMDPAVQQAVALVQDYQQGSQMKDQIERVGKTLEILFDYFIKEATPVNFKSSMKKLVRRALTTGVAYVKIGFQREYDKDPEVADRLADVTRQLDHIELLMKQSQEGDRGDVEARKQELQYALESLQSQEMVLLREGLVFDFPRSTKVIPDKMCQSLVGFEGARWITVEYTYTPDEVRKTFGVDLKRGDYSPYDEAGKVLDVEEPGLPFDEAGEGRGELVCVWEHYDREAGVVYYVVDGHPTFLRPPAPPDIYVEEFWPVYAITFNEVEDENKLFPLSDVRLIWDMQRDYNSARQGQKEHRRAARPRFLSKTGVLNDESKQRLASAEPFEVIEIDTDEEDVAKVVRAFEMPGVDPNLYETSQTMTDVQLVAGAQEASFGAVSKATATESSIAEGSRAASVDSNVDDLDDFLTRIAKASGQVLQKEMSEEQVKEIVGPGAVWPSVSLDQIAKELYLEVEAGSSGKPNQAQEIKNWREMLPFAIQMPGINPEWLARETLRRLDDRMDLTDALTSGLPAIVTMNRMSQPGPADPANAPDQQGAEGADQGQRPPERTEGTDAPMGNNQV